MQRKKRIKRRNLRNTGQAQADAKENGRENVVNGTLGAIHDEALVFLKIKKRIFGSFSSRRVGYAPIAGVDFCVLLKRMFW